MLTKHQSALKKRMERLNFLWDAFSDELRWVNPPVASWFVYDTNPHDEEECAVLGFGKINGKWGIYTGVYRRDPNDPGEVVLTDVKPIGECSAEKRIELVKYVPDLRKEVDDSFKRFISSADDAIAEFESQIDLSGFEGEDDAA